MKPNFEEFGIHSGDASYSLCTTDSIVSHLENTSSIENEVIALLLNCPHLTTWERRYTEAAAATGRRSGKQVEKLQAIAARRLGGNS